MSYSAIAPASKKSAYQRPYKSRHERREIDRSKSDDSRDYKFLIRVGLAIGLLMALALGIVIKGMAS